jgi:hypothetical protein
MDVARLMVEILNILSFYPEEKEGIHHVNVIRMKNLNHRLL